MEWVSFSTSLHCHEIVRSKSEEIHEDKETREELTPDEKDKILENEKQMPER